MARPSPLSRVRCRQRSVSETGDRVVMAKELTSKVFEISGEVKKISAQTKLLAINAAVEAARAGEAGKGFAVVAAEVKALSDRTASATHSISDIVGELHKSMDEIAGAMEQSTQAVTEGEGASAALASAVQDVKTKNITVNENVTSINDALAQQRGAADQIATGVDALASNTSKSSSTIDALNRILDAVGVAKAVSVRQLDAFAKIEVPKKVIKLAQADHVLWKLRLINMLIGREEIEASELADHHSCRLGKWYDAVSDAGLQNHPAFRALKEPHRLVHQNGIVATNAYNAGNQDEAIRRIAGVEDASAEVVRLLKQLEA